MRAYNTSRIHQLSAEELAVYRQLDPVKIPQHVAIIMDGNGRWAGKRALKRFLGHQQGAESVQFVVETASRISNFLLWQIAYAEIFVTDRLWPDFRGLHLLEAIQSYQQRERRFGGLGEGSDEDLSDVLPAENELARR